MKLNLREVPFSYRGSYLAVSYLEGCFNHQKIERGMYLRTVHGSASSSFVARVETGNGDAVEENGYAADADELRIEKEGKKCRMAFHDADTLLLKGDLPMTLDFMSEGLPFTFSQPMQAGERRFLLMNCFRNNCRYVLRAQQGRIEAEQEWDGSTAAYCRLHLIPDESGEYLVSVEEAFEDWQDRGRDFDFEEAAVCSREAFEAFHASMPSVEAQYEETARIAAYVDWSSIVKPCGLLTREAMLMSKNWMCNVWSWDHCFNAMALSYGNPKEAWDQFLVLFDHQKPSGNIPDSVNDSKPIHNYCKPPIHGWALRKLMGVMELSMEQLAEAYDKLSGWTNWWLDCRDENGDGLCEYTHGNDSGWDNSTAFLKLPPATLPDLAAFLVLQMDVLAEVAGKLGRQAARRMWERRRDEMRERMLEELFVDDLPVAYAGLEKERVETDSLILYLPIVLGKLLPGQIQKKMIEVLKGDKFLTAWGLATESPKSGLYESDGYWRGPIWAPSTMLILDGLMECGEKEYVQQVTRRFCEMVGKSGCAENFDALTGDGLRDRAYTWTASVMLVMAHEYLA